MKPVDFGIAFTLLMIELAERKYHTKQAYILNIISLCLYLWGLSVKEIDETRRSVIEIISEEREYNFSAGRISLINFLKEKQERKLMFVSHMATVATSQPGDISQEQLSFIGSFCQLLDIPESVIMPTLERGEELAAVIKFIVIAENGDEY